MSHAWLVAVCAFTLDQLSKWIVLVVVDLPAHGTVVLVPGFLKFVLAWNTGINFGILSSNSMLLRWLLVTIALAVSLGLLWWIWRGAPLLRRLGVGLIVGGALANAVDRVVYGAVVDFLNVSTPGIENPFSFNVADVCIFVGAAVIILSSEIGSKSNVYDRLANR